MRSEIHRRWSAEGNLALLIEATDPRRLSDSHLHPLVVGVKDLVMNQDEWHWTVEELVPWGPFRFPNRYRASRVVTARGLIMEAWSWPAVHLVHTLVVTEQPSLVDVEHVVVIEAPALLHGFVERTARAAHDTWVERVRAWMAAKR